MTDRDHGDGPDDPEELGVAADPAAARSRKATRQGRRRSLRVPVDDVPRRSASNIDLPAMPDLDGDGLPALAAEPTQVAPVPIDGAPTDGARTADGDPSVEIGLDLADDDLHDEELDDLDGPDLDGADLDAADLDAAIAASDALLEPEPAPSPVAMLDGATAGADDGLDDDRAARAFAADGAAADLETDPTRVAQPLSDVMPPPAWVAASAAPFVPGAGVSGRPLSVPPPSAVAAGAAARPLTVPPPARPASVPPPASVRPASMAPRPASVPPPASAKPASVPPPAASAEPGPSPGIDVGSADAVTSPGTTSTPNAEPQRAPRADQPAVVVARTVRVSAPPPAPIPLPAAIDDEPELSVGEVDSFEDLDVDDDREPLETRPRDSAPDLTDEAFEDADGGSSAELELPEEDALDADEPIVPALRPPPPPREAVRSEARVEVAAVEPAPPASDPEHEEELHDLEVDAGSDLGGASPEERQAYAEAKLRSAPPPPPDKTPKGATPPEKLPKAAAAEPATEPARKKKKSEWWEDFFNDDYLRTVAAPHPRQIARQCDFIEARFGLKEGGTILDVGCGLGLHAIELTRRGYLVVGLDLSLPMLSRAADEAQDQGFRINFLHADMKEMNFEGAFDAVMCIGTTYGYFDDDANRAVVERLYRALKPKGKLLLEVVNRDFVVRSQPNLVWFEGDGCVVMEETKANYISSRLEVKRTVILDDGRQRDNAYSVRLYALHELGLVLHQRGFRVLEVSGREATPGVFFGADSPKVIILAERRVQQAPPPPKKPGAASEGAPTGEMMPLDAPPSGEPSGTPES